MSANIAGSKQAPFIVAIGGTTRANSSTERALRLALKVAEDMGARTLLLAGSDIDLPNFSPERSDAIPAAERLVKVMREADGVIIGSPGYHGGVSGLVKNALDYLEEMNRDARPYLDGRAVGCVATGAGWQGAVATLTALRTVVHALRGWPTPVGVAINSAEPVSEPGEFGFSVRTGEQIALMARQVVNFSRELSAAA
ncbi:NAD(P)H-dependent oxidoreductase [Novosphingobium sp.]|uniref:NADPH-dependent FMN reductase n=1 Tax=Novosphingobium sp. TaxID=1874826 RepID=UPI002B470169|nr:NAD(P)H-dependent oxidoreductase [Novosphingobium sp.]HKR93139.1 NAD(P)H-dependent oxidoreductase [Novosphingobium sp.]